MAETHTPLLIVQLQVAGQGHDREGTVVVYPRAGLVGLPESPQQTVGIGIHPAATVFTRLRTPEVHTPGYSHCRIGVAVREGKGGCRAHQGVDRIDGRGDKHFVPASHEQDQKT